MPLKEVAKKVNFNFETFFQNFEDLWLSHKKQTHKLYFSLKYELPSTAKSDPLEIVPS
jgi:hypothetical protein